jgi:1-acyl-sn-glycerol-3-phosphate acyltransferase
MTTKRHRSQLRRTHLFHRLCVLLSRFIFQVILRTKVHIEGRHHLPRRGRVILSPNHRSLADPPFYWMAMRRFGPFIGATEAFQAPVAGHILRRLGYIEVVRGDRHSGATAQHTAASILRQGGLIGICPEGGCSIDGVLMPFKNGPARLAVLTHSPIVPLAIVGAEDVLPMQIDGRDILEVPWYRWFRFGRTVRLRFGPPISPAGLTVEQLTARLRQAIEELLAELEPHRAQATPLSPAP